MATETYKYFIADTNLRSAYGGVSILNNGDTAEVTKETLCLRYIATQLNLPANYTQYLAQIGVATGSITYIRVPDVFYSAISSYLTASELASVVSTAPTGFALGSTLEQFQPLAKFKTIILIGDSITDALGLPSANKELIYAAQAINSISGETLVEISGTDDRELVSKNYKLMNIALGGSNFDNAVDTGESQDTYPLRLSLAYNQRVKTLPLNGGGANNIISIWLGTNDLAYDATVTASNLWTRVTTRLNAITADFPDAKIIFCTTIKRGVGTPLNTRISEFNTIVRASYASIGIDVIADFEDDIPQFNVTTGNVSDTTYYTDTVHLTQAGHALLASVWKNALLSIT